MSDHSQCERNDNAQSVYYLDRQFVSGSLVEPRGDRSKQRLFRVSSCSDPRDSLLGDPLQFMFI